MGLWLGHPAYHVVASTMTSRSMNLACIPWYLTLAQPFCSCASASTSLARQRLPCTIPQQRCVAALFVSVAEVAKEEKNACCKVLRLGLTPLGDLRFSRRGKAGTGLTPAFRKGTTITDFAQRHSKVAQGELPSDDGSDLGAHPYEGFGNFLALALIKMGNTSYTRDVVSIAYAPAPQDGPFVGLEEVLGKGSHVHVNDLLNRALEGIEDSTNAVAGLSWLSFL